MVDIAPFKGVLYNQKKIPLSKVIAPPYDIISPLDQDKFYRLHPLNVIRLILGKVYYRDDCRRNRYTRSAYFYKKWLERGELLLDTTPSIYIYRIDFVEERKRKTRLGFIALASLRGARNRLIPHEGTFSGPKDDRMRLLRACRANFSQIFTLYSDPKKRITRLLRHFMEEPALIRVRYKKEKHFIWKVNDKKTIQRIKELMHSKKAFIADGHHRYEVSLAFSEEIEKKFGPHAFPGSHYSMLYFSNMDGETLSILPSHRLVRRGALRQDIEGLKDFFDVISTNSIADAAKLLKWGNHPRGNHPNRQGFGLLAKGQREIKIFILRDSSFIKLFIKGKNSDTKKNLSVTILDEGVLKGFLKIKNFEKDISYTRSAGEARKKIEEGHFSHAFLLGPTGLSEFRAIARLRERMPHKSTYFYPKLLSGLIIYDHGKSYGTY